VAVGAILWDLDGVIVDSMEYHFEAFREVLTGRSGDLTREEYFGELIGLPNDAILERLLGPLAQDEVSHLKYAKEEAYRRRIVRNVRALPGALELVARASEAGVRQAIVSSTPRENIALILRSLQLADAFATFVGEEDVLRGKPNPEGFLLAADRVSIAPEACVVIEDAPEGIAAGKAAGMRCIGVTTTRHADRLTQADLVVDNLEDAIVTEFLFG